MDYEVHEAALIFPVIAGEELVALVDDIREHGLLEPITIFEGKILDGRNRLAACELADVEPRFEEVEDVNPLEFVVSKNLHRRHLTAGQKAALALDVLPALQEEAAKRKEMLSGRPPLDEETRIQKSGDLGKIGKATVHAGEIAGVSASSVENARAIKRRDPEVFEKLRRGEINIRQALNAVGMVGTSGPNRDDNTAVVSTGRIDSLGREITIPFGKGDKWKEATTPILRYLRGWKRRGYEFRHIPPKEARKRLALIQELQAGLDAATEDLERRAHSATLTVKG